MLCKNPVHKLYSLYPTDLMKHLQWKSEFTIGGLHELTSS